jgi:hypothetical protein
MEFVIEADEDQSETTAEPVSPGSSTDYVCDVTNCSWKA